MTDVYCGAAKLSGAGNAATCQLGGLRLSFYRLGRGGWQWRLSKPRLTVRGERSYDTLEEATKSAEDFIVALADDVDCIFPDD